MQETLSDLVKISDRFLRTVEVTKPRGSSWVAVVENRL